MTRSMDAGDRLAWRFIALLLVVPLTAIVHHLVFFERQCMFNSFGPRYDAATILAWLRGDPSPYVGLGLAGVVYVAGLRVPAIQWGSLALLIATLPLSLWIWDLPLGDRPICRLAHDGRSPIQGRHLYLLALFLWPIVALWLRTARVPRHVWRSGGNDR